jgi:serine protease AprX
MHSLYKYFWCICLSAWCNNVFAQANNMYVITLKDKQNNIHTITNPSSFLSAKAITLRNTFQIAVDSTDLPISAPYKNAIAAIPNVTIINVNKWFNRLVVKTNNATSLAAIEALPFVLSARKVNKIHGNFKSIKNNTLALDSCNIFNKTQHYITNSFFQYGEAKAQIDINNGSFLHDKGFTGNGVLLAIFDSGFKDYLTHNVFDSARSNNRFKDTWDFINQEASVNEDDEHGLSCLGVIGSNKPGSIVGTAPNANFVLYRTEDVNSEYPIEELHWVAAAERADSMGVQIISSSLGYFDFDNAIYNYTYANMNGNTTYISRGANMAFKKGMIVVNSAGNEGQSNWRYVAAPADAENVFVVGGCDAMGNKLGFSSIGFENIPYIKPNIVTQGISVYTARANNNLGYRLGTSFAAPNIAGLTACLWQAFPNETNASIQKTIEGTASNYNTPNKNIGYGVPDFKKAFYALKKKNNLLQYGAKYLKASPAVFDDTIRIECISDTTGILIIDVVNSNNQVLKSFAIDAEDGEIYMVKITDAFLYDKGVYKVISYQGTPVNNNMVIIQKNKAPSTWIKVYPTINATNEVLLKYIPKQTGNANVTVTDSKGSVLYKQQFNVRAGLINYDYIPIFKTLFHGTYFVTFVSGEQNKTFKVIK